MISGVLFLMASLLMPLVALANFYVSPSGSDSNPGTFEAPFRTIDQARLAVRNVRSDMSSDITVYLRGGTYVLSSPLVFDANDSGMNGYNIVYLAYPDETPIISGGRSITGWAPIGGGIYRASVKGLRFRQLFINGQRGIRARTPNVGSYYNILNWIGTDYTGPAKWDPSQHYIDINISEMSSWGNLNKVEMVISKEWVFNRLRVASFSTQGSMAHVSFLDPDLKKAYLLFDYLRKSGDPYYLENAREFLDQPGEWYLDEEAGVVDYMPDPEEDMSSVLAVVPVLERLVQVSHAQNIRFQGITFEDSTWLMPSDEGYSTNQGDVFREPDDGTRYSIPGALYVEYSDQINFERNVIRNAGGAGLALSKSSGNISVVGNVICEIAAGGIDVALGIDNTDPTQVVQNIIIRNNYITGIGLDYPAAQGIQTHFVKSLYIDHNEIADVSYSGIGIDWRGDDGSSTVDLQITNNHIQNVMNMLSDGGGIYTYRVNKPQTRITGNYVHKLHRSAFGGQFPIGAIYLDEGSDYVIVKDNVLADAGTPLYTDNLSWNPSESLHHNDFTGYNPGADSAVVSKAGIEPAYRNIKSARRGCSPRATTSALAPTTTAPLGSPSHVVVTD